MTIDTEPTTIGNGESIIITTTASDPEEDILAYTWYVDDVLQSGEELGSFEFSATPGVETAYTIKVVADDGDLDDFDEVVITVEAPAAVNTAPTVTIDTAPTTIGNGETIIITTTASDPEEDPLNYNWYVDEVWQSGEELDTFEFSAAPSAETAYTIKVVVDDGDLHDLDEVVITVEAPAPVNDLLYFSTIEDVSGTNMWQVWTVNPDGTNPQRLSGVDASWHCGIKSIAISPDGNRLAYDKRNKVISGTTNQHYVVVRDLTDGQETEIALSLNTIVNDIEFSPDGTQLLLVVSNDENPDDRDADVYYCDLDGSNMTVVTSSWDYFKGFATWGPTTGTYAGTIAYSMCATTWYADPFTIRVIDEDGTNDHQIATTETSDIDQAWDGFVVGTDTLVYAHDQYNTGSEHIRSVKLDGSDNTLLHTMDRTLSQIKMTRDGNYALYRQPDTSGTRQIFRITISDLLAGDFSNVEQITSFDGANFPTLMYPTM